MSNVEAKLVVGISLGLRGHTHINDLNIIMQKVTSSGFIGGLSYIVFEELVAKTVTV